MNAALLDSQSKFRLASGSEKADLFFNKSRCMMSADRNSFPPISRPVRTRILLCSIVILISAGPVTAAKEPVAVTHANVMTEMSFASRHVHQDPFNEVALDVIFLDPAGREMRVPAFWDGGNLWKVRYSSSVVGTHHFRTVCSDLGDSGLHGITGSIE